MGVMKIPYITATVDEPGPHARATGDKFWSRIQEPLAVDACWTWIGAISGVTGYGNLYVDGKTLLAHRFAYEAFILRIALSNVVEPRARRRLIDQASALLAARLSALVHPQARRLAS